MPDIKWRRNIWSSRQTITFSPWMDSCKYLNNGKLVSDYFFDLVVLVFFHICCPVRSIWLDVKFQFPSFWLFFLVCILLVLFLLVSSITAFTFWVTCYQPLVYKRVKYFCSVWFCALCVTLFEFLAWLFRHIHHRLVSCLQLICTLTTRIR